MKPRPAHRTPRRDSARRPAGFDRGLLGLILLLVAFLAIAILFASRANSRRPAGGGLQHLTGPTMGTVFHVRLGRPLEARELAELDEAIHNRLETIDSTMSTYRSDSEVSRFNASRSTDWFPVSPDVARVVEAAGEVSHLTGGAFDITVAPLVELWGFGSSSHSSAERNPESLPSPGLIAAARAACGFAHLEVRHDPPALRKSAHPGLQIDLSGIAKGFAVDAVAAQLEALGLFSYLVEIGGELRVGDPKPDGSPWRVGIESPVDDRRTVDRVLELSGTALATSGDYRNFFTAEGRRYSHLLDPRTGNPVPDAGLGSVSVLAPTCQDADAMATALFVLGPVEGLDFAEHRTLPTLFLIRHNGEFSATTTGSFKKQAVDSAQWTGN